MKDIYLDGASNTPIDKDVLRAMKPFLSPKFVGNSNSPHSFGIKADQAIYEARKTIADCLKVEVNDVFFTSGATESNNWAIKSVVFEDFLDSGNKKHIICSSTEHDSVLNCCKQVEKLGVEVTYVNPPKDTGKITLDEILPFIREDTGLICVMAVNNETGVVNDIENITRKAAELGIKTLVDCTQLMSYGGEYMELGKKFHYANFFSFSSHKIYGPLGVGCLITQGVKPTPLIIGGAQEQGVRGGTSNTAGIVGLGVAIKKMHKKDYSKFYESLRKYLQRELSDKIPGVYFNYWSGHANIISLNCSNVVKLDNLARELADYGIAVSAGSACDAEHDETQGDFHPSHVLKALGMTEKEIRNTIRISFTKYTTEKDIDRFIKILKEIIDNEN